MKTKAFTLLMSLLLIPFWGTQAQSDKKLAQKAAKDGDYLLAAGYYLATLEQEKKPHKPFRWKCDMQEALQLAEDSGLASIAKLQQLTEHFVGDASVAQAQSIVNRYDSLMQLPPRFARLPEAHRSTKKCAPLHFELQGSYEAARARAQGRLDSLKRVAAEFHRENGLAHLQVEDLESKRAAYREFQRAQYFVPGYRDCDSLQQLAHQQGQRQVLLLPFPTNLPTYQWLGKELASQIPQKAVTNLQARHWVRFWTLEEAAARLGISLQQLSGLSDQAQALQYARQLGLHELWMGQVTVSFPKEKDSDIALQKSEKVKKIRIVNGKPEEFEATESFTYNWNSRKANGKVELTYQSLKVATGEWQKARRYKQSYDEYNWATFKEGSQDAWKITTLNKTPPKANSLSAPQALAKDAMGKLAEDLAALFIRRAQTIEIPLITQR